MAGALVDRATSDMLMRPDGAMNVQICEILNRDPGYAFLLCPPLILRLFVESLEMMLLLHLVL